MEGAKTKARTSPKMRRRGSAQAGDRKRCRCGDRFVPRPRPLIDMAGKLADGVGSKRKARSARKTQKKQKTQTKQKDTATMNDRSKPVRKTAGDGNVRQRLSRLMTALANRSWTGLAQPTGSTKPADRTCRGLAAGALLAALLPARKAKGGAPPGRRSISETAKAAAAAAKEAGTSRLAELGPLAKRARRPASIFQGAEDAARTSASALSAARERE